MVVFVDYEHDAFNKHRLPGVPGDLLHAYVQPGKPISSKLKAVNSDLSRSAEASVDADSSDTTPQSPVEQETPNRNGFSAALSCYPIVKEIARSVDMNTLHALSRTCRQFHANLAPYRHQLIKQTLRCENEYIETLSDMLDAGTSIPDSVKSVLRLLSQGAMSSGQLTSGKIGKCARDMVWECRRCSRIVCRNCTIKPPMRNMLKNRIRRLCTTCRTCPLAEHLTYDPPSASSPPFDPSSFTAPAFMRTPCSCEDSVWLCHPCGQQLRNSDTIYRRAWTWRTRYSTYLGGLGTGIGDGCQGVKCGRGEDCLAAQVIELEVECESDKSSDSPHDHHNHHGHGHGHGYFAPHTHRHHDHSSERLEIRDEEEPGYFRQEIIGIGGRVKHKAKKRVEVGACVVEYEDEREKGQYLSREEEGQDRSWCGWCWRVIPAKNESVN